MTDLTTPGPAPTVPAAQPLAETGSAATVPVAPPLAETGPDGPGRDAYPGVPDAPPLAARAAPGAPTDPDGPDGGAGRAAGRDGGSGRWGRIRSRATAPGHLGLAPWEAPTLAVVLAATAALYLWSLGASGWANSFYSAAVQAGSVSWKAFLFGSSDAAGSITVDKPPASLWVMALSVRLFGLSSWSILAPQALMGVGTVATVWYGVRRWFSAWAAVLAAVALAVTPVAVLMFRFNNPDALLALLMSLAAVTTLLGIEDGRRRWVVATGVLCGLGFLTKQLQIMLILPPFALAHLVAAPGPVRRRIVDLLTAGGAMLASAGWWVALVELWPAGSRPWIGGSQTNSILELTFGYNGLGRLTGDEVGSVGGGGATAGGFGGNGGPTGVGGGMWGSTGITRLIDGVIGGQIAWLFPVAFAAIVAGLWLTRRAPRTDLRRASILVWGGWLVITAVVFSFMAGIFHEYYTVALAPATGAMVGIGAHLAWRARRSLVARVVTAAVVVASGLWAASLIGRADGWNGWLQPTVLVASVVAALALVGAWHRGARVAAAGSVVAAFVLLAGPSAWALQTAATAHTGSIVTAGPSVQCDDGSCGGPGGGPGRGGGQMPGGFPGGGNQAQAGGFRAPPNGMTGGGAAAGGPGGGMGGLLEGTEPSDELASVLLEDADSYTWIAAAIGSNNASGYQLATERSVMPIGGFNGSDPSPTLEELQQLVADGEIHWFIGGGGFGPSAGGSDAGSSIDTWVADNFDAVTIDGVTLYDLSGAST